MNFQPLNPKNKKYSGIVILLIANGTLIFSFILNILWSNISHSKEAYPIKMDLVLRLLYLISIITAFYGFKYALINKNTNNTALSKLLIAITLTILPAFILYGQIWGIIVLIWGQ